MGLNGDLVLMLKTVIAKDAWFKSRCSRSSECVLIDLLLYIRTNTLFSYNKEKTNGTVTGTAICEVAWNMCQSQFKENAAVCVLIIDDPNHTPRQKQETQSKRSQIRKIPYIAYPPTCKFEPEGICYPDENSPGLFKPAEPFDIESVLRNRVLRKQLANFISIQLSSIATLELGQYIVFHYDNEKKVDVYGPVGCNLEEFSQSINHYYGVTKHGEFDTTSVLWGSIFIDKYPIRIKTKDTDMIPLWCCFIDKQKKLKNNISDVIWEFDKNMSCNINILWNRIQDKTKIGIHSFMTLCALAGNDYLCKNIATHNIGVPVICEAIKRSNKSIILDPKLKNLETLKCIIRWCHTQLIDGAKFLSPAKMTELAIENGSRKKAKKRKTNQEQKVEENDDDDEEEEDQEKEDSDNKDNKSKPTINSVLVREKNPVRTLYIPSQALSPYSESFINDYWKEKNSKKITGLPSNLDLAKCLERLEFSLWFWEHQPFTNKRFEQTLTVASLSSCSSSSSCAHK